MIFLSKGSPLCDLEILGDFEQYRGGGQLPRTPSPYVFLARRRREKYRFKMGFLLKIMHFERIGTDFRQ